MQPSSQEKTPSGFGSCLPLGLICLDTILLIDVRGTQEEGGEVPVRGACGAGLSGRTLSLQKLRKGIAALDSRVALPLNFYFIQEKIQPKKTLFTVLIHTESGVKIAGTVNFNPSDALGLGPQSQQTYRLERCPDKEARFLATFSYRHIGDIDFDKVSQASGNSVSNTFGIEIKNESEPVRLREAVKIDSTELARRTIPDLPARVLIEQQSLSLRRQSVSKQSIRNEMLSRQNRTLADTLKKMSRQSSEGKLKEVVDRFESQRRVIGQERDILRARAQQLEQALLHKQQEYNSRLHALQQQNIVLKERCSEKENLATDLNQRFRRMEKERNEYYERLARTSSDESARNTELLRQVQQMSLQIKRFEVRDQLYREGLSKISDLNSKQAKERQEFQERVRAERQGLLSAHRQELLAAEQKYKALSLRLREKESLCTDLQARCQTLTIKLEESESQGAEKARRIRTLQENLRQRERQHETERLANQQLRRQLQRKSTALVQAQRKISSLSYSLSTLETERSNLMSNLSEHYKQNEKMQVGKVSLQTAIRSIEKRCSDLQIEGRSNVKKVGTLLDSLSMRLQALGCLEDKGDFGPQVSISVVEQRFTRIERFLEKLYERKTGLQMDLGSTRSEGSRLQSELNRLTALCYDLETRLKKKEGECKDLGSALQLTRQDMQSQRVSFQLMIKDFEKELLQCVRINDNLRAQYAVTYKNYSLEVEAKMQLEQKYSEHVAMSQESVSGRQKALRSVQAQLRAMQDILERTKADATAVKSQLSLDIEVLRNKYDQLYKDTQDRIQRFQLEDMRYRKMLAELEERIKFSESSHQQTRKQKASLERALGEFELEARRWQEENKVLGEQKIKATSELYFKEKTINDLTAALSSADKELTQRIALCQTRSDELLQLKEQLFQKQTLIVNLTEKLTFKNAPLNREMEQEYRLRIVRLQKESEDKDLEIKEYRKALSEIRARGAGAGDQSLLNEIEGLRATVRSLEAELSRMQQLIFAYSSREHELNAKEQSLRLMSQQHRASEFQSIRSRVRTDFSPLLTPQ